jgi:hypothetical protein
MLLVTDVFDEVWKGRQNVNWKNGSYQVVSPKGMRIMKEAAGRPKDLIDLDYLRGLDDES